MSPVPCAICNTSPAKLCHQCKSISYCSRACQSVDWPCHKLVCASFLSTNSHAGTQAADPDTVLGILFPAAAASPQLVRVQVRRHADAETGLSFQDVDVEPLVAVAASAVEPRRLFAEHNDVRGGRRMESFIEIWHAADVALEPNQAIMAAAAATKTLLRRPWTGNLVTMAMTAATGGIVDGGSYKDATALDFRDAVDVLTIMADKATA
jgi:hypothetical protein